MAFELKPFKDLIAMSKDKLDEALLPLRVRSAKAKAEAEVIRLEEIMLSLETSISTLAAQKELNFAALTDKIDEYELTERKLNQIKKLVSQLFPGQ